MEKVMRGKKGKKENFRIIAFFLVVIAAFLLNALPASAVMLDKSVSVPNSEKKQEKKYKEGELLVKFKAGVSEDSKKSLHKKHGSEKIKEFRSLRIQSVKLKKGLSVEEAISLYKADPSVEYAEPNYIVTAQAIPNDAYFNLLWNMNNTGQTGGTPGADIHAPAAWDITKGSKDVVVAVIDTGVDYTHEDIAANMWINSGETAGNGVDDDANGYIDDVYGINAITGSGDPMDDYGHGTHCAGTIGAVGNNALGVAGVNWNVKIMPCKFLDATGSGSTSGAVTCMEYVQAMKDNGVNIIATSNSWGGGGYSQALYDAIYSHMQKGILFIAAAGNSNVNNDSFAFYPANYDLPNIIAVAATDNKDAKASFSSYGKHTVHVGAPGVDIVSLRAAGTDMYGDMAHFIPNGDQNAKYYRSSGTSMATPHVAGLAALIQSGDMNRDWRPIKNLIITGGDNIQSMQGVTISGKRINAFGSLTCSNSPVFAVAPSKSDNQGGLIVSALSINCGQPAGPVTVTNGSGQVITLTDDGTAPDVAAGDGIFMGTYIMSPGDTGLLTYTSPIGTITEPAILSIDLTPKSVSGPSTAGMGQTISASAVIKNQGGSDAGYFHVSLYLSTDATITSADTYIGDATLNSLAAGAQQTVTISGTIPTSQALGTYYLGVIANPWNEVQETDLTNNSLAGNQIAITPGPDLIITSVSGPSTISSGTDFTVTIGIKNQGVGKIETPFYVGLYASDDATITTSDKNLGSAYIYTSFAPGGQQTITLSARLNAEGTYYLGAIADTTGLIIESNETNNSLAGNRITVTAPVFPDLIVTSVSGPTTGNVGNPFTVPVTIKNQGTGSISWYGWQSADYISIYLSSDATITTSDKKIGAAVLQPYVPFSLAAGATKSVNITATIPSDVTPGTYYIGAIADSTNFFQESNETNNSRAGNQITVYGPDLVMTSVSGPSTGYIGSSITVTGTVKNQDKGSASWVWVYFYLSSDNSITATDTYLGAVLVMSLGSGAQWNVSGTFTVPSTLAAGTYYIGAIADASNAIAESSETNNSFAGNQIAIN